MEKRRYTIGLSGQAIVDVVSRTCFEKRAKRGNSRKEEGK